MCTSNGDTRREAQQELLPDYDTQLLRNFKQILFLFIFVIIILIWNVFGVAGVCNKLAADETLEWWEFEAKVGTLLLGTLYMVIY